LVAVSGGPDSVALLGVLHRVAPRFGITVHAAHFNHGWRGAESDREQACAVAAAAQLGVECGVGASAGWAAGINLEAQARQQRYAFLSQVAAAQGCAKIATGHTLDDQAETVVMRLLRGTGWDGLAGIHPVRGAHIIRPLIECSRAQVVAFLQASGLPSCEDSSNADRRFLRNRVRHEVLPLLRAINPQVTRHLAAVADILSGEGRMLDAQVAPVLGGAQDVRGALVLSAVRTAPPALVPRLVRAWMREHRGSLAGLGAAHIRAVVELACGSRPNASVRLPRGQVVVREYERLWLRAAAAGGVATAHVLVPGGTVELETGWRISAEVVPASEARPLPRDLWSLVADADGIETPVIVRGARPGDRIRPLGMRGRRKLQDVFVDRKLPRAQRHTCPVVEVGGELLWVPGIARSGRALITPATRSALRLVAEVPEH
jgi:tRNA(Ile)-lysidine synthase